MPSQRAFYERFLSVRSLPVPVIACINGPAIGAGLCLAMGTDIRVTHDKASLATFCGLGLHPGGVYAYDLVGGGRVRRRRACC